MIKLDLGHKTIIIVVLSIIGIFLSGWFVHNFPRDWSGGTIYESCKNDVKKSEYCVGFQQGYDWAVTQVHLQFEIDRWLDERDQQNLIDWGCITRDGVPIEGGCNPKAE